MRKLFDMLDIDIYQCLANIQASLFQDNGDDVDIDSLSSVDPKVVAVD